MGVSLSVAWGGSEPGLRAPSLAIGGCVTVPSSGTAAQDRGRLYRDFGLGLRIVTPLGGVEGDLPFSRLCGRSPRGAGSRGRSSGRPWRSRTGSSLHSDCCPPCRTGRRGTPAPLWGRTQHRSGEASVRTAIGLSIDWQTS